MASIIIGINAERCVPATGTPYNNSLSDLASIMAMLDPENRRAKTSWWNGKKELGTLNEAALIWKKHLVLTGERNHCS